MIAEEYYKNDYPESLMRTVPSQIANAPHQKMERERFFLHLFSLRSRSQMRHSRSRSSPMPMLNGDVIRYD
jgi:hypothetical protein